MLKMQFSICANGRHGVIHTDTATFKVGRRKDTVPCGCWPIPRLLDGRSTWRGSGRRSGTAVTEEPSSTTQPSGVNEANQPRSHLIHIIS